MGFSILYGEKYIITSGTDRILERVFNKKPVWVYDDLDRIKTFNSITAANNFIIKNAVDSLENNYPSNISLLTNKVIEKTFLNQHDLMIISLESWKKLVDSQSDWLSDIPSVLIVKP